MSLFIESCGLAVEHLAHDRKVVGSIPVQSNARWKWCQSHARIDSYTQFWFEKNKKIQAAKRGTPKKYLKKKRMSLFIINEFCNVITTTTTATATATTINH
jgi:hypothetical protein